MPLTTAIGALLVVTVSVPAAAEVPQTPTHVRVVNDRTRVQRWYRPRDVLLEVGPGTTFAVLDKEEDWFWVMLPPDAHGTRRSGWIHARDVEPVSEPAGGRDEAAATLLPAADAAPPAASVDEDKVTITERRDDAASSAAAATKPHTFEDVYFDRDRYSLRPEDMNILRAALTALEADPSLVVNIEGHTCSLGTKAHNRALGARRADAVKAYLVSQGVPADRLHTVSLGEEHPSHDNSHEETRRLNRRVALVPDTQP